MSSGEGGKSVLVKVRKFGYYPLTAESTMT